MAIRRGDLSPVADRFTKRPSTGSGGVGATAGNTAAPSSNGMVKSRMPKPNNTGLKGSAPGSPSNPRRRRFSKAGQMGGGKRYENVNIREIPGSHPSISKGILSPMAFAPEASPQSGAFTNPRVEEMARFNAERLRIEELERQAAINRASANTLPLGRTPAIQSGTPSISRNPGWFYNA